METSVWQLPGTSPLLMMDSNNIDQDSSTSDQDSSTSDEDCGADATGWTNPVNATNLRALKRLIKSNKFYVNYSFYGETALHRAIKNNWLPMFQYLISHPDIDVSIKAPNGDSVLNLAMFGLCENRFSRLRPETAIIRSLLDKGVDVNHMNSKGLTPLHQACEVMHDECIYMLLYYGADPSIRSRDGLLPLDILTLEVYAMWGVLDVLFDYTYDALAPGTINLTTLSTFLYKFGVSYLPKLKTHISTVEICTAKDVSNLVWVLHAVPFVGFKELIETYPNIVEGIQRLETVDLTSVIRIREVEYLQFFADNCHGLLDFKGTSFLSAPRKISYELLEELYLTMLSHGVYLRVDLHELYAAHGFCALFKTLLHMEIDWDRDAGVSTYVPVFYNTTLATDPPTVLREMFQDQHLYFDECRVPSLVQLGRDAARKHVIQRFGVRDYTKFAWLLERLPVTEHIKRILKFEEVVYKEWIAVI